MILGQMFVAPAFREMAPAGRPARLLGSINVGERSEVNISRDLSVWRLGFRDWNVARYLISISSN